MTIDTTQRDAMTIDTTELEQAAAAVERELIAQFCEKRGATYAAKGEWQYAGACKALADLIRRGAYKEGKV